MGRVEVTDLGQDPFGSVKVVTAGQPTCIVLAPGFSQPDLLLTRRFGAPRNTEEKEETGDELDCEGNDPLSLSLDVNGSIAGVINPEA